MREANSPIHPDDLPALTRNHQAYLGDEDGLATNAAKLQDDAYALGYQRAQAGAWIGIDLAKNAVGEAWRNALIDQGWTPPGKTNALQSDALRKAQSIMTRWLVPDGIAAEQALTELIAVLDNQALAVEQDGMAAPA